MNKLTMRRIAAAAAAAAIAAAPATALPSVTQGGLFAISASAADGDTHSFTITSNAKVVTEITSGLSGSDATEGTDVVFTITGAAGYKFNSAPTVTVTGGNGSVTPTVTGSDGTYTCTIAGSEITADITGVSISDPDPVDYALTKAESLTDATATYQVGGTDVTFGTDKVNVTTTVVVNVKPGANKEFATAPEVTIASGNATVSGGSSAGADGSYTFNVTGFTADTEISVSGTAVTKTYAFTLPTDTSYVTSVTSGLTNNKATHGQNVVFTLKAADGYEYTAKPSVTVSGSNATVNVSDAVDGVYTCTVSGIDDATTVTIPNATVKTFQITPDGSGVTSPDSVTFNYNSSDFTTATAVPANGTVTITVTPDSGKAFPAKPTVTATGATVSTGTETGGVWTFTVTGFKADTTISVSAQQATTSATINPSLTLSHATVTYGSGISVSDSTAITVADGSNITFTIAPDDGYKFKTGSEPQVTVESAAVDVTANSDGTYKYTITGVTGTKTIAITATASQVFDVEVNTDGLTGATATAAPTTVFGDENPNVTVTITPNDGYEFTTAPEVSADGGTTKTAATAVGDGTYTFNYTDSSNPSGDITLTVTGTAVQSAPDTYTATVNKTGLVNADATLSKNADLNAGDSLEVKIIPTAGYAFETAPTVTVTGATAGTATKVEGTENYTVALTNVTGNVTVTVSGTAAKLPGEIEVEEPVVAPGAPSTDVTVTDEVASSIPLSEAEKAVIASGEDLKIYAEVAPAAPTNSEKGTVDAVAASLEAQTGAEEVKVAKYLDISLMKQIGNNSAPITSQLNASVTVKIDATGLFPDFDSSKYAERKYWVIAIHEDGTSDSYPATLVGSELVFGVDQFSLMAVAYADVEKASSEPTPVVVPTYPVTVTDVFGRVSTTNSTAGQNVSVTVPSGCEAVVYTTSGRRIATLYTTGTFVMPSEGVKVVMVDNGAAMLATVAPNSYIYSYDSSMKKIRIDSSNKGKIKVKLGAAYAGKTVTLYSGKASTAEKLDEAVLDANGNAEFEVDNGKNYTLVVED